MPRPSQPPGEGHRGRSPSLGLVAKKKAEPRKAVESPPEEAAEKAPGELNDTPKTKKERRCPTSTSSSSRRRRKKEKRRREKEKRDKKKRKRSTSPGSSVSGSRVRAAKRKELKKAAYATSCPKPPYTARSTSRSTTCTSPQF